MTHNYLIEDVFKGVDNTVKRLFNHRPFTEGEVRSFIANFEEKNSPEKISEKLDDSSERLCDINETLLPKMNSIPDDQYKDLIERAGKIDSLMNDILKIEIQKAEDRKIKVDQFIREENEKLVKYMQNTQR